MLQNMLHEIKTTINKDFYESFLITKSENLLSQDLPCIFIFCQLFSLEA